ncbi:MAG: ABC transporter permease [Thermofilaceae archaeon]|nr:ABC transporter permease [Thermofilaceae archaeon]MCX8179946.1 ABC transporter permease [Thermofilaceae archaeon]MDW8004748.1 ABC transporter permease [Thermofilaceae archaeon]
MKNLEEPVRVVHAVVSKEMKIMFRYFGVLVMIASIPFMFGGMMMGIGYAIAGPSAFSNFTANTGVSNPLLYTVLGGVLMIGSMILVENTAGIIRDEQMMGTFELHYLTPNSTLMLWLFHSLSTSLITLVIMTVDVTVVLAWQGSLLSPVEWLLAATITVLGLLPLAGLGLVVAALTVRFKEVWAAASVVNSFVAMLSGFYYPLEVFPRVVRFIAQFLPTSYAAQALRNIFSGGVSSLQLWEQVVAMTVLGFAYLVVGRAFYLRWENEAKRRGELSKY